MSLADDLDDILLKKYGGTSKKGRELRLNTNNPLARKLEAGSYF